MKCDSCNQNSASILSTYDIDGLYMQVAFCNGYCRFNWEMDNDLTGEERASQISGLIAYNRPS